eukprot:1870446-Lingulodinium_polyedra.AAC.1
MAFILVAFMDAFICMALNDKFIHILRHSGTAFGVPPAMEQHAASHLGLCWVAGRPLRLHCRLLGCSTVVPGLGVSLLLFCSG